MRSMNSRRHSDRDIKRVIIVTGMLAASVFTLVVMLIS